MRGVDFNPSAEGKSVQCAAVLRALKKRPQTTTELRIILGLSSSPAARVLSLRKAGHRIVTQRKGAEALYVLMSKNEGAA